MPHDETFLLYMLVAARRVADSITGTSREQFDSDLEKMDSVVLQIGNIGEAASNISKEFCEQHPELPWSLMIGMRHRIFHHYHEMDWDIVWSTATTFVPELIRLLETLCPPEDSV
jgi:uncharacterized protein with HEPN domain